MKRFFTTLLLCVGLTAHAQWYTGTSQQTGLVLCLHLADTTVEFYSPLQSSDPIPVSSWSLRGDTLAIQCKSIGFKMDLIRTDTTLTGHWRQGFMKEKITLTLSDTLFQLLRPQTPQPPYRFNEETVTTDYTDSQGNTVHLEGTLTYPRTGNGPFPTLLLVSGSGQQNRDEEIMQHRPFLVLADYLASRGIAVLRYDDRGAGASKGSLEKADTRLFAEDAEAMFRTLCKNKHVDRKRVGIGGHSEGGAIAPMIAAGNKKVKFVVMLAGQGCTGLEVMLQQNDALFRANGVSSRLCTLRVNCMRELLQLPGSSVLKDYQTVIEKHTAGLSQAEADSIELRKGMAHALKKQTQSPWMQAFLRLDPATYLPRVKCPVLALCGSKDRQVPATPNLTGIKTLCPQADCRQLANLNHLFQTCQTGSSNEYILIEETFNEDAMSAIADWILNL